MNYYETLGVAIDATPDEIATAYRMKARKMHPDAGGDKAEFAALAEAYEVLSDPEKRAEYDKHGAVRNDQCIIEGTIAQHVGLYLAGDEGFHNPIRAMCDRVDKQRSDHRRDKAKHESQLATTQARIERFEKANANTKNVEARDFILGIMANKIGELAACIEADQAEIEMGDRVLAYLNDIKWGTEQRSPYNRSPFDADYILNQIDQFKPRSLLTSS